MRQRHAKNNPSVLAYKSGGVASKRRKNQNKSVFECILMFGLAGFMFVTVFVGRALRTPDSAISKIVHDIEENSPLSMHAPKPMTRVVFYRNKGCKGDTFIIYSNHTEEDCEQCANLCDIQKTAGWDVGSSGSVLVEGDMEVNMYQKCRENYREEDYVFTLFGGLDECFDIWHNRHITHLRFAEDSNLLPQEDLLKGTGDYRIVYSTESSRKMGYQSRSNYWGFLKSKQTGGTTTRLVTMHEADDLVDKLSTFWAKRHPFSRKYSPFNKPDSLTKWFRSPNAPEEEVIILIDPDNWIVQDLAPIAAKVEKGSAIAAAAWFNGNKLVDQLYRELCTVCNDFVDYVAVPIFIHKDDMAAIAPLWRKFVIIIKDKVDRDPSFKRKYEGLQIDWGGEMHAYIMAASELGIRHRTGGNYQIRDVDRSTTVADAMKQKIPMIHMGRAWVPMDYKPAEKWTHTEGRAWASRGRQVWCKCNTTADNFDIWPIPGPDEGIDFQSYITLTYLHDSMELFDLPTNKFRVQHNYYQSYC